MGFSNESNLENFAFSIDKTDQRLINHISNLIFENSDSDIDCPNFCKYYSVDDFLKRKFNNKKYFSMFHLNTHSLQAHKSDLDILLDELKFEFDVIAISESRLLKGIEPTHNIEIPNYKIEHTPTEANKGGTLLYISENYEHKLRKDLEVYESKKIESTFVEILRPNNQNIIIGCIYKHHTISKKDFNEIMENLISKISKEKKICYLAGDFNMDLLCLHKDSEIEKHFDNFTSNNFMPLITYPTRIAKTSKTYFQSI